MNNFAAIAPFLWWTMLLSSTAIILHDLATLAFTGQSNQIPKPLRAHGPNAGETPTTKDLLKRSIEISSTGFQKEAAEAILEAALSAKNFPLKKIPEEKLDMVNELLTDPELRDFVQVNSKRTTRKIDRNNLKTELEHTYKMLEKAERLFN
jgi:hypothetical protein